MVKRKPKQFVPEELQHTPTTWDLTSSSRWIHGHENITDFTQTQNCSIPRNKCAHKKELTAEKIEARRSSARKHYANLKPEQRQAICERQRLLYANMTPEQKQAKRDRETKRCALQRNTPSRNSIAMPNPMYNPSDWFGLPREYIRFQNHMTSRENMLIWLFYIIQVCVSKL